MPCVWLSSILVGLGACDAPPPVVPSPTRQPAASTQPAPPASSVIAQTAAPVSRTPPFHLVLESSQLPGVRGYAFAEGGFLVGRSFMAVITGDEVRQDPAWLEGLPEFINWDSRVLAEVPQVPPPPTAGTIPNGTLLSVSAGNRHGPSAAFRRTDRGWTKGLDALDPRIKSLKLSEYSMQSLRLSDGHLLVVGSRDDGVYRLYTFAPGATKPSTSVIPDEAGDYRIVATDAEHPYLYSYLHQVLEWEQGRWQTVGGIKTTVSCGVEADGSLWAVDLQGALMYRAPGERNLERVDLPGGVNAEEVSVAGDRVFVSGATTGPTRYVVLSNVAVKTPLSVGEEHTPTPPFVGFSGLVIESQEVPNVSDSPPGPGTAACTSLVVYFGKALTPELKAILRSHPETVNLPLIQASGRASGRAVIIPGTANEDVIPSNRRVPAIAGIPEGFEQGMAMVRAIQSDFPQEAQPRLLCAIPRAAKKLGSVRTLP